MTALVILGMHRSGTSLVGGALSSAGISAGPEEDLLSAQADNPEGFFENRELVALNDAVLEDAGGSWFTVPGALQLSDARGSEALALFSRLSPDRGTAFFIKDPRLCLTYGLLAGFLGDPLPLFVYRSPLAVARSLQRRNHFPLQLGLQLWEIYNRRALELLPAQNPLALSYEQISSDPSALKHLLTRLRDLGIECDPQQVEALFRPDLQHVSGATSDPDWLVLTPEQRELHAHCESLCAHSDSLTPLPAEDPALYARARDLAEALAPLARVLESGRERDEALEVCDERTLERDRSLRQLDKLDGDYVALVAAHDGEKQLHQQAKSALESLESSHNALIAAHERELSAHGVTIGEQAKLVALHDELHAERAALERSHSQLHSEFSLLQNDHAALQDKVDYLFYSLTETYRGLLSFELSTMAWLQRQLRRVYRLLSLQRGRNSRYEDILEQAHEHFGAFELSLPEPPPGKLRMLGDVIRYVWRNPAGSARSFSVARMRRALSVFLGSSAPDLEVWVNARFPEASDSATAFDPDTLSEGLDRLELDFTSAADPRVSIVIPVFNDYRVTVNCLQSVLEHSADVAYEVILADDCSTDLTASIRERIGGIVISRTTENQRFLRNCNQAAELARGEFVVFLNNDTAVTAGWLEALLLPFAAAHTGTPVGVVGPKLLFADGRLQEAGGIVWRDASAWNFGRADDPDKPAYVYRREVDYVSGACLAIRRSLWESLGGFDQRFVPAYYEDADICFAARAEGYRVIYQPESVVYHFEGVSNGTDLAAGVKQHQVHNQSVFRDKWIDELDLRHFPNAQRVMYARDRSAGKPCVLVIDHYVPHHDKDAGGRSTHMYIKLLLELGCRVQFMGANFFPHQPYTDALQAMGVEVLVGESIARDLDGWLREHAPYIDQVFLHRPHVAEQFLAHLERLHPRPPISFFGHDLHYLRVAREAALKDDDGLRRESEEWRRRELAVCARVDRVYYFSQAEIDELEDQVDAGKLRRIPLYAMPFARLPSYAPQEPHSLLFVGGFNHPPNVDAACWLAGDILPRISAEIGDVHLHLVGSNATEAVKALAGESITVHGFLSDEALDALYRRAAAAVVPLRYGAGVKGKVIEAVRQNVPLVTTDIGAEGIPDAESVFLLANTAEDIARSLVDLLQGDRHLAARMSRYEDWLAEHFSLGRAAAVLAGDIPGLQLDDLGSTSSRG
ncbi:MAG: GT2 family glycosyltransferase/glycosyltransferase involved in cell wall biosynthesis [Halieaceae bacterium]